jgi:hypothetical protein
MVKMYYCLGHRTWEQGRHFGQRVKPPTQKHKEMFKHHMIDTDEGKMGVCGPMNIKAVQATDQVLMLVHMRTQGFKLVIAYS